MHTSGHRARLASPGVALWGLAPLAVAALVGCAPPPAPDPPPEPGPVLTTDAGSPPPALRAAAATVNITPEPGVTLVGWGVREATGVRDPLEASVLLLARDGTRVGLVTLDLPGIADWHAATLRRRVALALRAPSAHVVVTASHTHSAPLLGVDAWSTRAMDAIVAAAEGLDARLAPARLSLGEGRVGFDVNRRRVIDGQSHSRPDFEGARDPRVRVLRVDDIDGARVATVVHAVCHPNVLRGTGSSVISADFVGEARARRGDDAPWLFLQGAAGDVRSRVLDETGEAFREGTDADLARIGAELARAVADAAPRPLPDGPLGAGSETLAAPQSRGGERAVALSALGVGPLVLLTIPGEPMVEIGLDLERALRARRPGAIPLVLGYTNGYADYIVTEEARRYGGYEVRRSQLAPEANDAIAQTLLRLADALPRP